LSVAKTRNEQARAKYEAIFLFAWTAITVDPDAFKIINRVKVDSRCADDPWRLPVKYLFEATKQLYRKEHGSLDAKAEYPSSTLAKAVDLVRIAAREGVEPDAFVGWWDKFKGLNDILDHFKVKPAGRSKPKTSISLTKRQWRIIQRAIVGLASVDETAKARVLVEDAIHSLEEAEGDDQQDAEAGDDADDAPPPPDGVNMENPGHEDRAADEQPADDQEIAGTEPGDSDSDPDDDPPPSDGGEPVPTGDDEFDPGASDAQDVGEDSDATSPTDQQRVSGTSDGIAAKDAEADVWEPDPNFSVHWDGDKNPAWLVLVSERLGPEYYRGFDHKNDAMDYIITIQKEHSFVWYQRNGTKRFAEYKSRYNLLSTADAEWVSRNFIRKDDRDIDNYKIRNGIDF